MAEPDLGPCAALVRRADPDLFHSALFAPDALRDDLLTLYAADVELSRAAGVSAESLINRMRLQWWRDLGAGPPPDHEIAGPFVELVARTGVDPEPLITPREAALAGDDSLSPVIDRHRALARLAAELATGDAATQDLAAEMGAVRGHVFAVRNVARMAAERGAALLAMDGEAVAALGRGETPTEVAALLRDLATDGAALLDKCRVERSKTDRSALPVFLSAWRADRVFARAQKPGFDAFAEIADPDAPHRARILLWRAITGRW